MAARGPALARIAMAGLAVVGVSGLAGCGSHSRGTAQNSPSSTASTATTGHASIGPLRIAGGYIPQPASPDVAAAYLTIINTGSTPDRITKITTNVTKVVMAMNETDHDGVGTMTGLRTVTVPAHGRVSLVPGHSHLMLEKPTSRLRVGQQVSLTITFAHAGTITLTVPVVPLTGPASVPSMSPMASP